ncbi:MAG TPA: hypothetical protein VFR78_06425 [Pyrinomonadaceae bacterium]|nr:hypothetical protein [Pyrinomonadaceae bacterium]
MDQKRRNGFRAVAALLVFSIAQVGLQVAFADRTSVITATTIAPQTIGRLTTKNNQPVSVNGLSAATGASILSGATIETGNDQSATVDLGPIGSLEIDQNTRVVLTYDEQRNVKAHVLTGCVTLRTKSGTSGEVISDQGFTGRTNPAADASLNNCSAPRPGPPPPGTDAGGLFGLGRAATIAIFAAAGAAASTPLFFDDNPSPSAP